MLTTSKSQLLFSFPGEKPCRSGCDQRELPDTTNFNVGIEKQIMTNYFCVSKVLYVILPIQHAQQYRQGFSINPNIEIRNPARSEASALNKFEYQMTKTNLLELRYLCHWNILILVIVERKLHSVSYFVVSASFTSCRISNF